MSKGNEVALSIRTAVLNPAYKYVTGIFVKRRDALPSRGAVWKPNLLFENTETYSFCYMISPLSQRS